MAQLTSPLRTGSTTHELLRRAHHEPFATHEQAVDLVLTAALPPDSEYRLTNPQLLHANPATEQDEVNQQITIQLPIQATSGPHMNVHTTTKINTQPDGRTAIVTVSLISIMERDPLELITELSMTAQSRTTHTPQLTPVDAHLRQHAQRPETIHNTNVISQPIQRQPLTVRIDHTTQAPTESTTFYQH
jgi:hypothetical protein